LGLVGVTAIDIIALELTVRVAVPVTDPDVAVIVVWPGTLPAAFPFPLMVATVVFDELQVTDVVRFAVELSE
jgi:hypothetical protein